MLKSITNLLCANENMDLLQEKIPFWFNALCAREYGRREGEESVRLLSSPWEAMFLSQTSADTASWSETEKISKISPAVRVAPQLLSPFPLSLLIASDTDKISRDKTGKILQLMAALVSRQPRRVISQCLLSFAASFLAWVRSFLFKPDQTAATHTHTKPPLSVAATNYLGEKGQGKWSTGWREKRHGGGRRA